MLSALVLVLTLFGTIPLNSAASDKVTLPAVHFKYTDPNQEEDVFPRDTKIKIEIPVRDLSGLGDAKARLFTARYVADPDDPAQIAIQMTTSKCKYFQSKIIPFTPSLTTPYVNIGRLEDTDLRCGSDHNLADTVCYLVVSKESVKGPLIRLDPDEIGDYFEYAYRFVVTGGGKGHCSSGTEAADKTEEQERQHHPARYIAAKRASNKEQRKLAEVDGTKECVKIVK
jgi:hypothetical protein